MNDDCISRQAAIRAIWDGINMDIYTEEVKEILEGLPSVQSMNTLDMQIKLDAAHDDGYEQGYLQAKYDYEAKTGHWIVSTDCEGKTRQCTCDLCGYETGEYTWENPNFCENCGAKMEGKVEAEIEESEVEE